MKNAPLISVIVPSYNYAAFLPECLASILEQNTHTEVLLADDGSQDGSLQIIREFVAAHPRQARLLQHPQGSNRGLAQTLRMALTHSKGEWIAFLEADDIWLPQSLVRRAELFNRFPESVLVHGTPQYIGDPQLVRKKESELIWRGFPPSRKSAAVYEAFPFLLKGNVVKTLSSAIIRKSALTGINWSTPHDAWTDWWVLMQLSIKGPFCYDPTPAVQWRIHSQSYNNRYCLGLSKKRGELDIFLRTLLDHSQEHLANHPPAEAGKERLQALRGFVDLRRKQESAFLPKLWHGIKRLAPTPLKQAVKKRFFH